MLPPASITVNHGFLVRWSSMKVGNGEPVGLLVVTENDRKLII